VSSRLTLGYRETTPATPSWMGEAPVTGHEFHRTRVEPRAGAQMAWELGEGWVQGGVHASYLHLHWAGVPGVAERFVAAAQEHMSEVAA
jgi:cobyrinic acid a,c-diamide synthase